MHRGAHQRRREALRGRARVVRRVAMVAVEVFLDHELAAARDEHGMDRARAHGRPRGVDQALDEGLDASARNPALFYRSGGPAVVALERQFVAITGGLAAARIERARRPLHLRELVYAAAIGKRDREASRIETPLEERGGHGAVADLAQKAHPRAPPREVLPRREPARPAARGASPA